MAKAAKHNPNMIHHYCYYPHYSGDDCSGSSLIDATALLLMLNLANDIKNLLSENGTKKIDWDTAKKLEGANLAEYEVLRESLDHMLSDVEGTIKASYALSDAIEGWDFTPAMVIESLCKKGYFVSDWEEGSFYFSTDEALEKAQKKLNKMDAAHDADAREF